jgi:hypothetical protein
VSSAVIDALQNVKALPDEVAAGHAGRLRLMNDYPNARSFLNAARLQPSGPSRALGYPDLHVLAKLNNQSVRVYVAKHSMIPFTCFPQSYRAWDTRCVHYHGLSTPRAFAYLCAECVREDRSARGFGHWRRCHQLVGREHCTAHPFTRLTRVDQVRPFDRCPSHWVDKGCLITDPIIEDEAYQLWRRRLVEIEQLMFDLGGRCRVQQQTPTGVTNRTFDIPDMFLYEMGFGRRWKREHRAKTTGVRRGLPSADGQWIALRLASRFNSAEDALNACELILACSRFGGKLYRLIL